MVAPGEEMANLVNHRSSIQHVERAIDRMALGARVGLETLAGTYREQFPWKPDPQIQGTPMKYGL